MGSELVDSTNQETEVKDTIQDRLAVVKQTLTPQYINTLLGGIAAIGIACAVIFSFVWKNPFLLKLTLMSMLILACILMVAKFMWYPETRPIINEHVKDEKKGMFDSVTSMLPDSDDYQKNLEKSFEF